MLTLSFWAKKHPAAARWLIAANRILLGSLGFFWGFAVAGEGQFFSKIAFGVSAGLFLIAFAAYPRRQAAGGLKKYRLRKFCDAALVAASLVFWVGAGNWALAWSLAPATVEAATCQVEPALPVAAAAIDKAYSRQAAEAGSPEISNSFEKKRAGFFKKLKTWRQSFFQKMKSKIRRDASAWRSAARQIDAGTAALLVLASLAIIFLLGYLTVAVSCNLSCNGQEGAATVVLIIGLAAIIGSIALMWSAVAKAKRRKHQPQAPPAETKPQGEAPLASEAMLEVANASFQACLSTETGGRVTVRYGEKVLAENVKIGAVPRCFDIEAKPGEENLLTVEPLPGSPVGKMKLTAEDGKVKKSLQLAMEPGQAAKVNFQLKP